jgi:hypothetical protein
MVLPSSRNRLEVGIDPCGLMAGPPLTPNKATQFAVVTLMLLL